MHDILMTKGYCHHSNLFRLFFEPILANHIERLIQFVCSTSFGNRPWFLLLPQWVHKKEFFLDAIRKMGNAQPFYVVPRKRYVYLPPGGFREAKIRLVVEST